MTASIGILVTTCMFFLWGIGGEASIPAMGTRRHTDQRFKQKHKALALRAMQSILSFESITCRVLPLQLGLMGFCLGYYAFRLMGVALALGLMAWASYFKLVKLLDLWRQMKIQRELPQFFGILQGWSEVNNNLLYCLEKVSESGLSPNLIQPYKQCLREAKSGVPLERTLERLREHTPTETQRHFVFCLLETNRRQGKLSELFKGFEAESSQVWLEIQRTSLLRLQYRLLIYGLSLFTLLLLYLLLKHNQALGSFYLHTVLGRQVLTILSLLTAMIYVREAMTGGVNR